MSSNVSAEATLQAVRKLERLRIVAIRSNDANAMAGILDERFIYINGSSKIYDRDSYSTAVRTHKLTYFSDLQLIETDHRAPVVARTQGPPRQA